MLFLPITGLLAFFSALQSSAPAVDLNIDASYLTFSELEGVRTFSGRLIVRPVPIAELQKHGLDPINAQIVHAEACRRLSDWVWKYVADTDEFILQIPAPWNENSMSAWLMETGDYQYAEPDWLCAPSEIEPNDPGYSNQWHHAKLKSSKAWEYGFGDGAFIAAVVDSGVDLDHPDLEGALISGYNSADGIEQSNGGSVDDVSGHGTSVIGCLGAIGNNATNVAGMAWDIKLMPVRATNRSDGWAYTTDLTEGVRWASDNGARAINCSYQVVDSASVGTTGTHVRGEGSLLTWCAGNSGNQIQGFDHQDVIVVSASNRSDVIFSWSNFGDLIDVAAPGGNIHSTANGGGVFYFSGTSFSAPIVCGILGMMMLTNPSSSADQIEQMLFDNCVDIDAVGEDVKSGHGRPNFFKCMRAASLAEHGETNSILMTGPKTANWGSSVTYDWTDAPASSPWALVYSLNPYGSKLGGQYLNIGTPRVSVGSGNSGANGAGSFSKTLRGWGAAVRVYVEVVAISGGQVYDSNMIVLDIN